MRLRLANAAEIPVLRELRNRAAWAGCTVAYTHEQLERWLAGPLPDRFAALVDAGTVFVAEDGARPVGYGALNVATCEVEAVFVEPEASGRGVGKALLQALEAMARVRGLARLTLSASLNAVPFYSAAGYEALRNEDFRLASGAVLACVVMHKRLQADATAAVD